MGFGELLRNITVTQTDSVSGQTLTETIVTGPGAYYESGGAAREFRGLLGVPAAWRATQLITDVIGGIPWHAYEAQPGGLATRRYPSPRLLEHPAGLDTRVTTYSSWALDLIWHGNAIGIIWSRDMEGEPDIIIPVPAEYTFVKRAGLSDNLPAFVPGEVVYLIGQNAYKTQDIMHIKGLCRPGALRGLGVLEQHFVVMSLDVEQRKQASASTGAGIPTGVLKSEDPDLTEDDAISLAAKWAIKQETRRVAVLNASTSFVPLAWNPRDSQLLEARKFGHVEMALVFGVDPEWLGSGQSTGTYRNIEQSGIELIRRSSLHGHLARFEAALSMQLRPGSDARANLDSVQRADTHGRYEAHKIGIDTGFLTDDEARVIENMPPLTTAQRAQIKASRPAPPAPFGGQGSPNVNAPSAVGIQAQPGNKANGKVKV